MDNDSHEPETNLAQSITLADAPETPSPALLPPRRQFHRDSPSPPRRLGRGEDGEVLRNARRDRDRRRRLSGLDGFEEDEWQDDTYQRALTAEELSALIEAGLAGPEEGRIISIEEDTTDRDTFFARLREGVTDRHVDELAAQPSLRGA